MGARVIEARATRKTNNALTMTFLDSGVGQPMAVALQGGADGKGAKVATLFGFKNGGAGTHLVTYADDSVLHVKTVSGEPTVVTTADGTAVATIERSDEKSVATAADGTPVLTFVARPDGARTPDAYRLLVLAPDGSELGTLDIIRTFVGWNLYDDLFWEYLFATYAQPLRLPFLGSRIAVSRDLTDRERDVLVAASVDIAIGLRPYVKEMKS